MFFRNHNKKEVIISIVIISIMILITSIFILCNRINENKINIDTKYTSGLIIDITDLEKGDDIDHTHIYKWYYDEEAHYQYCTVDGCEV